MHEEHTEAGARDKSPKPERTIFEIGHLQRLSRVSFCSGDPRIRAGYCRVFSVDLRAAYRAALRGPGTTGAGFRAVGSHRR
jgi:hypothetical protein